jgi:hypothetical protein
VCHAFSGLLAANADHIFILFFQAMVAVECFTPTPITPLISIIKKLHSTLVWRESRFILKLYFTPGGLVHSHVLHTPTSVNFSQLCYLVLSISIAAYPFSITFHVCYLLFLLFVIVPFLFLSSHYILFLLLFYFLVPVIAT